MPPAPVHHDVISRFTRWSGRVPAGHYADFLGAWYKTDYFKMDPSAAPPPEHVVEPGLPGFNEEYFEWIDLLQAVCAASGRFTMFELGAGWGRWTASAAAACRQRGLEYRLVSVEAEPTHFQWLIENLDDNGVRRECCTLVEAAVTGHDGTVSFHVGDPATWYGQCVGGAAQVRSVSLATLLADVDLVDLVDMDVQGSELEIVAASEALLAAKVKRAHIETHSAHVHDGIERIFRRLGWQPHFLFEGKSWDTTPWGRMYFQGGTESWLNPTLCGRDELEAAAYVGHSAGWRAAKTVRLALERAAPAGSSRARTLDAMLSRAGQLLDGDLGQVVRRPSNW
jgi:FkbM family methyltransferase